MMYIMSLFKYILKQLFTSVLVASGEYFLIIPAQTEQKKKTPYLDESVSFSLFEEMTLNLAS